MGVIGRIQAARHVSRHMSHDTRGRVLFVFACLSWLAAVVVAP